MKLRSNLVVGMVATLALAGCDRSAPPGDDEQSEEPASIIRPDVEVERAEPPLEPLRARISFDDGGFEISAKAREELAAVLETRQFADGGAIVVGGHTDSEGYDAANLRASQRRADVVRDWLVESGVNAERVTVIAFGEQNPAKPNAKPDGTPNEAGRAYNRRAEVIIKVPPPPPEQETLLEQVAEGD